MQRLIPEKTLKQNRRRRIYASTIYCQYGDGIFTITRKGKSLMNYLRLSYLNMGKDEALRHRLEKAKIVNGDNTVSFPEHMEIDFITAASNAKFIIEME